MTREQITILAQEIVGRFQWLDAEEERQVMKIVNDELWLRRERQQKGGQYGRT